MNKTEEIGSSDETIESMDVVDNKNQGTKKASTRKKSIPILDQEERKEKNVNEVRSNLVKYKFIKKNQHYFPY